MVRRARIPGVVAAFPSDGPPALRGTAATPRLTRRTQARGIRRVHETGDQSVAVRIPPRAGGTTGAPMAAGGAAPAIDAAGGDVVELFRLKAADGERVVGQPIPLDLVARGLLVYNPLSAPVYIKLGAGNPTALVHDLAAPGSSVTTFPIDPRTGRIAAVIDYPGAVPAGDVADVVVRVTSAPTPAFVGPLT